MRFVSDDAGMKVPCRRRARIIARGGIDVNLIFGQGLLPGSFHNPSMCGERSSIQEVGDEWGKM
jgi:hypothetical protein